MLVKTHLNKMRTKITDGQQLRELLNKAMVTEYGDDGGDKNYCHERYIEVPICGSGNRPTDLCDP